MSFYNYEEIDNKIDRLNSKIMSAAIQSNLVLKAASIGKNAAIRSNSNLVLRAKNTDGMANSVLKQPEKMGPDLSAVAILAAEEIKEYVAQIWNDNQAREEELEKLQDELNENIRFLAKERNKLQCYIAEQKNVSEKKRGLEESIGMVIGQLRETEAKLQEVYNVYRAANNKGWKIIFYPALAFEALKYTAEKKDQILEEQRRDRRNDYKKLFGEQQIYLQQEAELDRDIQNSMNVIAQADTVLITQKMELGRLKDMIVKGSNAYIYYSMLGEKIQSTKERLVLERDFCENIEKVSMTQKELEELLETWEQNKNDSETVYQILQRMFDVSRTECYGKEIGEEFDDSSYIRSRFEKIRGVHIQSGYIIDGIQVLYENEIKSQFHGKMGGSEYVIEFDPGDELRSVEGHYSVPYMIPSGDAIGELFLITKKGKRYGPYGDSLKRGFGFRIELPENAHFLGVYGKSSQNQFITKLGLLYAEAN